MKEVYHKVFDYLCIVLIINTSVKIYRAKS